MLTLHPEPRTYRPQPRNFLGTMEVFQGLPEDALKDLEGRMVEKKFAKGEGIYLSGDPALYVWFVKSGHVKATVDTSTGRCQTLCMVGQGQMFGSCCCLGGGSHPCNAAAAEDVIALRMPTQDFLALAARYAKVSAALVGQISRRLRVAKDTQAFEQETVEKRILRILLELVKDYGDAIPLTRRALAEMAGTTVETAIRTFVHLEAAGLVSSTRGLITVRDRKALAARLAA